MSEEGEDEDKKPSPIEARIAQVSRDIYSCSTEIIFYFGKQMLSSLSVGFL